MRIVLACAVLFLIAGCDAGGPTPASKAPDAPKTTNAPGSSGASLEAAGH